MIAFLDYGYKHIMEPEFYSNGHVGMQVIPTQRSGGGISALPS